VVQNGTATKGGGIEILGTETTIENCQIRENEASDGDVGYGGGLYAYESTIHVNGCEITSNTAMQGGGIYLDHCTGTISNTVVSGNELIYGTPAPNGGGICIANSTGISMSGNTISQNSAALLASQAKGGGLYLSASTDITLDGDVIAYNRAGPSGTGGGSGGGVYLEASGVTMTGVTISRCWAKTFGGGIFSNQTSSTTLTESSLMWNSAVIGGGAYLVGPSTTINHNLIVGNTGTGCYVFGPLSGSIIGNTMDRNTGGATGGTLYVSSTSIPLFDNVIVNSSGDGIRCSGTPTPTPEYNDVWNNSGSNYTGCSPGTGSISADPVFVDTSAVDYHLGLHSPAIDAGNPAPGYADPDGSRGDMGRYGSHVFMMDRPAYPKNAAVALDSIDAILSWASGTEPDISFYGIYKDTTADFVPSADNFVQLVAAPDTTFNAGRPDADAYFKICALDSSDYSSGFSGAAVIDPTGVEPVRIRYTLALDQNVPNPFNPATRIGYEVDRRLGVTLAVYDVAGRRVKLLVAEEQGPGRFAVEWDGTTQRGGPAATGVYFYRLQAGERTMTRKMLLLK
ncbi:MAG: right-handed parallel beta-helix repeat-containing protein, partial [bacterium]